MGEANYYLKARFRSPEEAEAARPRLAALLAEGEKAYEYWQGSRPFSNRSDPKWQPPSAELFWKTFRLRYPLVYDYLRDLAGTPDWNNGLAGCLDLVDPRDERRALLFRDGDTLFLRLNDIWHCADMSLLERYCRADLGAVGAGSVSDEHFDPDEYGEDFDPFLAIDV
jgi:hypothetical protein